MSISAILYQTEDKSITLLDIPRSIELAQLLDHETSTLHLLSSEPLRLPHASIEPIGLKKRQKILSTLTAAEQEYHQEIQCLLRSALCQILSAHNGTWYLPRSISHDDTASETSTYGESSLRRKSTPPHRTSLPPIVLSAPSNDFRSLDDVYGHVVTSSFNRSVDLKSSNETFRIPPYSTFLLSNVCSSLNSFSGSAEALLRGVLPQARKFDFIVMDPPWSNRSVERSSMYTTAQQQADDPFEAIRFLFSEHISDDGIVAVWVTNKWAIRRKVLDALLQHGLELIEELIWLKITIRGEPVTELNGLWRHPYEICLLFRRVNSTSSKNDSPKRRVILAVPDVHSRKPHLKQLTRMFFPELQHTLALEVFARNLTAGWWSWGEEVLKYANMRAWVH